MTPFLKKSKLQFRLVRGSEIRLRENGGYAGFHWTNSFKFIDFDKSLGRVIEDHFNDLRENNNIRIEVLLLLKDMLPTLLVHKNAKEIKQVSRNLAGIYFLFLGATIVYVGISNSCIKTRLLAHAHDPNKLFDGFAVSETPTDVEPLVISALTPIYNKTFVFGANDFKAEIAAQISKALGFEITNKPQIYLPNPQRIKIPCFGDKYLAMDIEV